MKNANCTNWITWIWEKLILQKNIPPKFDFIVCNKNNLLEHIYNTEYGNGNWQEWYYKEFNKSIYNITKKMLSYLPIEKYSFRCSTQ